MQYAPCNVFVPAVNSAKISHKNILRVTIIDSHGRCENAWKEAYFHLCVPAFQSKHKAWIMHIYVTSICNQPIHLYNTTAYTLAIQKQVNRVVSLKVWHIISVGICHSGLYEQGHICHPLLHLRAAMFRGCLSPLALKRLSLCLIAAELILQRGASEVFWTQKFAKWCTLTGETKPARHQHMLVHLKA